MPSAPNTPLVLSTLQTMCRGIQVNGSTFFASSSVIIGKSKDVTGLVPLCEITSGPKDETQRYTLGNSPLQGGKVDDTQNFMIEITLDNTDSQTVESTTLPGIRDALTALFHASATLGLSGLVQSASLTGDGDYGFSYRNGQWWRSYRQKLHVRQEYSVIIVP